MKKLLLIVAAIGVIGIIAMPSYEASLERKKAAQAEPTMTPEQKAKEIAEGLAEKARKTLLSDLVRRVHGGLRDPRSMEVREAYAKNEGDILVVCLEFSGRNGFNAVTPGYALTRLDSKNKKATTSVDNAAQWNKHCVGKRFYDHRLDAELMVNTLNAR